MAAVNITINGVICDLYGRTITGPVKIVGEAMYTDLGVGGGPIFPSEPPGGGNGKPPGIWGPTDPRPTPPIYLPPGKPDVPPDTIWPGPGDPDFPAGPHPEHPIVIPPPVDPGQPPIQPGTLVNWKAVWVPPAVTGGDGSWMVVGVPNVPHPSPSR